MHMIQFRCFILYNILIVSSYKGSLLEHSQCRLNVLAVSHLVYNVLQNCFPEDKLAKVQTVFIFFNLRYTNGSFKWHWSTFPTLLMENRKIGGLQGERIPREHHQLRSFTVQWSDPINTSQMKAWFQLPSSITLDNKVSICVVWGVHISQHMCGCWRTTLWSRLSSVMWVAGIELRSLGLAASTFTH